MRSAYVSLEVFVTLRDQWPQCLQVDSSVRYNKRWRQLSDGIGRPSRLHLWRLSRVHAYKLWFKQNSTPFLPQLWQVCADLGVASRDVGTVEEY